MNQAQKRAITYAHVLNEVIEDTQKIQDDLNPKFQQIKEALATGNLIDMKSSEYLKIQGDFQSGTDEYAKLTDKLHNAKAPAKLMGVHLSLVQAYKDYTQACQDMINSMKDDRTVDESAFAASEEAQDQILDKIGKYLMKMNQMN
ncbi:hypothetical protein DS832_08450 [Bombilactobacillus bombi]|uniref:Chemotaxis protein n=1 Tax=Bombilactobacillus bombi TaxID=1303590 RepID=A0A3R6YNP7_9LACO|nr:hypothetical protein [Bombilactobacillus bombi]RHW45132.1 hypothetical protein DS832_08450 [Bombilactobacillus bombi]